MASERTTDAYRTRRSIRIATNMMWLAAPDNQHQDSQIQYRTVIPVRTRLVRQTPQGTSRRIDPARDGNGMVHSYSAHSRYSLQTLIALPRFAKNEGIKKSVRLEWMRNGWYGVPHLFARIVLSSCVFETWSLVRLARPLAIPRTLARL